MLHYVIPCIYTSKTDDDQHADQDIFTYLLIIGTRPPEDKMYDHMLSRPNPKKNLGYFILFYFFRMII